MFTLMQAGDGSGKPVKAAVLAASMAVVACFGAAFTFVQNPAQASETQQQLAD